MGAHRSVPPRCPFAYHQRVAFGSGAKRLLLGRALRTEQNATGPQRGGAVPVFSGDALSSNVYATQEILVVLALGGLTFQQFGWLVSAFVVATFTIVVSAYRFTLREYPGGGGDYDVAAANLSAPAAVTVGSAMLVDFALTLAVSVAAILDVWVSVVPEAAGSRLTLGVLIVIVLALVSLRASPGLAMLLRVCSLTFVGVIVAMTVTAVVEVLMGDAPRAASAQWNATGTGHAVVGVALLVVLARAFSSGSVAVTGVEAIGTAVPTFRAPRGPNAARAMVLLATMSMTAFLGITWVADVTDVQVAPEGTVGAPQDAQRTLLIQLADAVFGNTPAVVLMGVVTTLILAAAGINSYRSFSVLTSVLARDGYLPHQLQSRGDRLVYSNGIIVLAVGAGFLLGAFHTSLTTLIQLYVVGVFLALTLGQAGMVRHWSKRLGGPMPEAERSQARRLRLVALGGQMVAGFVLLVVLVSKFTTGAWVVALLIPVVAMGMLRIRRHYDAVAYETAASDASMAPATTQVIALILVSSIRKPTLRAVAYARATRPTTVEAVTVAVDPRETARLAQDWEERGLTVPLRVLDSHFREINSPVIEYVRKLHAESPDALLTVYVPEYVVSHWWEELLHNQSAARLKRRLTELPNVVVVAVPWQMWGSEDAKPAAAPGP